MSSIKPAKPKNRNDATRREDRPSDDLPTVLKKLEKLNVAIEAMENNLNTLLKTRRAVEGQLARIRASNAPIRKLPVEILSSIFRELVDPENTVAEDIVNAARVRTDVMLVCKPWRDIVVNDPRSWRNLLVTHPDMQLDMKAQMEWVTTGEAYIEMCMARSKETPLNVVVNLHGQTDLEFGIMFRFKRDLQSLVRPIWNLNGFNVPETVTKAYVELNQRLVKKVVGHNGIHMKRWNRLNLIRTWEQSADDMLPLLCHPCPQIQRISLHGKSLSAIEVSSLIPLCHSISEIDLWVESPMGGLPPCPSLRRINLTVSDNYDWNEFHHLVCFPALREIFIDVLSGYPDSSQTPILGPIKLPDLDYLHLSGEFSSLTVEAFECKRLDRLTIEVDRWPNGELPKADIFSRAEYVAYIDSEEKEEILRETLDHLLPQLSSAHTLQVRHHQVEIALQMVALYRSQGYLPYLRAVVAKNDSSELPDEIHSLTTTS